MLRKLLKWTGLVVGSLLLILLATYFFIATNIAARAEKQYTFASETIDIPTDSATLIRGRHLTEIKGCTDCHASNLAGRVMMDGAPLGRLVARNLTKGKGGLPADYSTADWVMALRHGVDRAGKPLLFMPAHETTLLSKPDMAAIISYCQQLPPVATNLPENRLGPIINITTYLDKMPLLSVEKIDHAKPMLARADTTVGIAQGKYLAVSCTGCHRPDLKGGDPVAPGFPPVPNITRSGNVGKWSEEQFIHTLRTGKTPKGHQMSPDNMPWKMTAQYTQNELASLYQYVRSIQ